MQKVYLKGFERPHSIIGDFLFEDERFYVLTNQGLESKIPWSNILYIEVLETAIAESPVVQPVIQIPAQPVAAPPISPTLKLALDRAMAQSDGAIDAAIDPDEPMIHANVIFTGFKQKTFSVDIPAKFIEQSSQPSIMKTIFADPGVKADLGDFILAGPLKIEGENVFVPTAPVQDKAAALKDKLDITSKFLSKVMAGSAVTPSLNLDAGFGLVGSPFKTTVPLQDMDHDSEEV